MNTRLPNMNRPCANCPFRKDAPAGWLGRERMEEIVAAPSFVCHKTINKGAKNRMQCAGHMLLMQDNNQFFNIAKRLGIDLNLSGGDLVFTTPEACVEHHAK